MTLKKAIPKRGVPIKHVSVVLKVIRKPSFSSRSQKRHQHARRRNTKKAETSTSSVDVSLMTLKPDGVDALTTSIWNEGSLALLHEEDVWICNIGANHVTWSFREVKNVCNERMLSLEHKEGY